MAEYDDVMRILMSNKDKNFVQRVLQPDSFPHMDLGNGEKATHKMAWSEVNGKYVVYPTILYDNGNLVDAGDKAINHALRTNNFISFDTPEQADWFSKRYKAAWGE